MLQTECYKLTIRGLEIVSLLLSIEYSRPSALNIEMIDIFTVVRLEEDSCKYHIEGIYR